MKKSIRLHSLLISTLIGSALAMTSISARAQNHPCEDIRKACEAGGYTKGGHKNGSKGLWVDCVAKIRKGETVTGVTVAQETVSACEVKKEKREERRNERKTELKGANTQPSGPSGK